MKRVQRVFGDLDALRYVDDRLDLDRRTAFERHLAADPDQGGRVRLWARQNEALRNAFATVASEPVPLWLRLDQLSAGRDQGRPEEPGRGVPPSGRADEPHVARLAPSPAERSGGARMRATATAVALVAAGALSIVAARALLPSPAAVDDDSAPVVSAADDPVARAVDAFHTFARDPTHPVELTALDRPALEEWLSRRAGLPVRAPDLRDQGWTLLGGRTTPGGTGPAAFLLYDDGSGRRLGLYEALSGQARTEPGSGSMPDGATLSWTSGEASYVVATEKDVSWVRRNAAALKARVQGQP